MKCKALCLDFVTKNKEKEIRSSSEKPHWGEIEDQEMMEHLKRLSQEPAKNPSSKGNQRENDLRRDSKHETASNKQFGKREMSLESEREKSIYFLGSTRDVLRNKKADSHKNSKNNGDEALCAEEFVESIGDKEGKSPPNIMIVSSSQDHHGNHEHPSETLKTPQFGIISSCKGFESRNSEEETPNFKGMNSSLVIPDNLPSLMRRSSDGGADFK